jgi:hypothetical protein
MMLTAEDQQNNLRTINPICPSTKDDRFDKEIKQICATQEQAKLSTTEELKQDGPTLQNKTQAEILNDN